MSKKYLDIFCQEAEEHLASLQSGLLVLEQNPGRGELLRELLRNAHTLKGSARMVSLADISAIAHTMEEQLKEMEQGTRPVDAAAVDLLLTGADAVALITAALYKGEAPALDVERFVTNYQRGGSDGLRPEQPATLAVEPAREPASETVRADVKTLDSLVNLIGEMIINKKRLEMRLDRLRQIAVEADRATGELLREFRYQLEEDLLQLDYLIQEVHEKAMGLRMLPLQSIAEGFKRLVRDLSQRLGNELELVMDLGSIEMDRVLVDGLKPMLIHLLTNAVCHGIESPEQRLLAGKEQRGTILLTARHEGSSVLIKVRDDGRGMDPERIRQAAVAVGLIDRDEAEALGDEEALYLTLRPGFSTVATVTDVSGRGVGMDAVTKQVERFKGNLSLASALGSHTEITLQLPLTLSVLEALLVESGGETFAIPVNYLQEIIKVREADITRLDAREVIEVRGATTALYSLQALLGLPQQAASEADSMPALVLRYFDQRIACTVQAQAGNSVVVVKGLSKQFGAVKFLFGATILGDGNPALILNVPDLFAACSGEAQQGLRRERSAAASRHARVLVVDDSITTRTMEQNILVTHGYQVQTALSGEDALEKTAAAAGGFDLIITDLEMPGISGFQLTRQLRACTQYRDTPIIVVSSLCQAEEKQRALQAGAQAYLVKGDFDQGVFLETVRSLIGSDQSDWSDGKI